MKIAVVKPDYKITGGFEIAMDRIIAGLRERKHEVKYIKVDMTQPSMIIGDISIPYNIFEKNREFFTYTSAIDQFAKLDLSEFDLVVCTQPPSFAVNHPKTANIFYHHQRIYYDLYDLLLETRTVDRDIHSLSAKYVREIDTKFITQDKLFIAGGQHIADRLKHFNNIDAGAVVRIGIDDAYFNYNGPISYNDPIYVGRHEFPKRPEMFIHAMKHTEGITGRVVGQGGKTEDLKRIDRLLSYTHSHNQPMEDDFLWKTVMMDLDKYYSPKYDAEKDPQVVFTGRLTEADLIKEYAECLCIVCPSFDEDFGLTPIEAMAFRKPAIVCADGGGYVETVKDGVTGFVVEPTAEAIAEKITYLKNNPDIARQMGENAYLESRKYDWKKVNDQLNSILVDFYHQ